MKIRYDLKNFLIVSVLFHLLALLFFPKMEISRLAFPTREIMLELSAPVVPETLPALPEIKEPAVEMEAAALEKAAAVPEKFLGPSAETLKKNIIAELSAQMKKAGNVRAWDMDTAEIPFEMRESVVGEMDSRDMEDMSGRIDAFLKKAPAAHLQGNVEESKAYSKDLAASRDFYKRGSNGTAGLNAFVTASSSSADVYEIVNGKRVYKGKGQGLVWDLDGDGAVDDDEFQVAASTYKARYDWFFKDAAWKIRYSKYPLDDYLIFANQLDTNGLHDIKESIKLYEDIRKVEAFKYPIDTLAEGYTYHWVEPHAIKTLIRVLKDQGDELGYYDYILKQAVLSKSFTRDEERIDKLIRFAVGDDSGKLVEKLQKEQEIPQFIIDRYMESPDPALRAVVVQLLKPENEKHFQMLLKAAADKFLIVRSLAAKRLAESGDQRAVPALMEMAKEDTGVGTDYTRVTKGWQRPEGFIARQSARLALYKILGANKIDIRTVDFADLVLKDNIGGVSKNGEMDVDVDSNPVCSLRNSSSDGSYRLFMDPKYYARNKPKDFYYVLRHNGFKKYINIRTRVRADKNDYASPIVRFLGRGGEPLKEIFLSDSLAALRGSGGWRDYSVTGEIPVGCVEIRVQMVLAGKRDVFLGSVNISWSDTWMFPGTVTANPAREKDKRDNAFIDFLIGRMKNEKNTVEEELLRNVVKNDALENLIVAASDENEVIAKRAEKILMDQADMETLVKLKASARP
ncbi:MAG: HEAT repeat domain-containing protein [Elusimicrobiota bacterium]